MVCFWYPDWAGQNHIGCWGGAAQLASNDDFSIFREEGRICKQAGG
jgi:hypothetical protein